MPKLAEHFVEIGTRLDKFKAGMSEVESRMKQIGQRMSVIGKSLTTKVSLPLVALAGIAVKTGADFEQAMMNAASVSGATADELKSMEMVARDMGKATIFSAKQAADAMYYMASAGWKANQMAKAIKPTLDLAAATQSDLAFTTNTVVSALNQFGLEATNTDRVTNVFAAAIGNSQATLEKLSISMQYVGPIFHSMGKSVEEATSTLMGLYNAGYDASMAGTALRMGMARLLKPTKQIKEAIDRLGLSFEDIDPTTHKFADIIDLLAKRGATTKDIIEIFGVRAGPAFAALISQGADKLKEFEKAITGTEAATKMAEMQLDTLKSSFKLLVSALTEVAIQISKILGPMIRDLVENKIKPAVEWFSNLSEGTKKSILIFAGLVAAAGPLLLIFGKFLTILPALRAGILSLSGPIGVIIAATAALGVALNTLINKYKAKQDKEIDAMIAASKSHAQFWTLRKKLIAEEIVTVEEWRDIYNKHGRDYKRVMRAIATLPEYKYIRDKWQEMKEAQEKTEESGKSLAGTLEDEIAKALGRVSKEQKTWIDYIHDVGLQTIKEKQERIVELNRYLEQLNQAYKDGKINIESYTEAQTKAKDEIMALSASLAETALPATRDLSDILDELPTKFEDLAYGTKDALDKILDIWPEFIDTIKEDLAYLTQIGIVGVLDAFHRWGEEGGNILTNLGEAMHNFVGTALDALKRLVAGIFTSALQNVLAKQAEAIAGVIASVMTSVPFPLNLFLVGGAIATVSALFRGLMPKKMEKGGWIPSPMLVEAGHGPRGEIIAQPAKLAEIITREIPRFTSPEPSLATVPIQPIVNIYAQRLDRDTIDRASEEIMRAINRTKKRGL